MNKGNLFLTVFIIPRTILLLEKNSFILRIYIIKIYFLPGAYSIIKYKLFIV